mmetsp:Transcript_20133/g.47339  ORF Transcript_20133/g.47339 Transcript_20133/m.47339 type:complete len:161 (-) Transcript_20133:573-1055(-)
MKKRRKVLDAPSRDAGSSPPDSGLPIPPSHSFHISPGFALSPLMGGVTTPGSHCGSPDGNAYRKAFPFMDWSSGGADDGKAAGDGARGRGVRPPPSRRRRRAGDAPSREPRGVLREGRRRRLRRVESGGGLPPPAVPPRREQRNGRADEEEKDERGGSQD